MLVISLTHKVFDLDDVTRYISHEQQRQPQLLEEGPRSIAEEVKYEEDEELPLPPLISHDHDDSASLQKVNLRQETVVIETPWWKQRRIKVLLYLLLSFC